MVDEIPVMVYPFPENVEEWKQSMQEALEKEFISEAELTTCLDQGCVTIDLLAQIHAKIASYSSFNRLMFMAHWMKIRKNIDLSDDDWFRFNL